MSREIAVGMATKELTVSVVPFTTGLRSLLVIGR
jgi:hypothetical protein